MARPCGGPVRRRRAARSHVLKGIAMAATRDVATRDGAIARARTCFDDGGFIERLCALVPGVQPTVIATVSGNVVTQGGAAMPGNLIGLIVDRAALSYQIQPGDSLMMV